MTTITFESNFGNFDYRLTMAIAAEITKEIAAVLVEALANLGFRACGSNVEKALVKAEVMGKDDKRVAAEYSEDNAEIVREAAQATLDKICKEQGYPAVQIEVTGQHVFGETEASRKMATAMWAKVQGQDAMLLALGADDNTSDEDGIELCHKFLATLRKPKGK